MTNFCLLIEKHKQRQEKGEGRGPTSYLTSTVCDEIIEVMGKKVLDTIINEIREARYYSVSLDSTPDASKVDRCTVIFRYIPPNSLLPVERFTQFVGMEGHKAEQIAETLFSFISSAGIDIKGCIG